MHDKLNSGWPHKMLTVLDEYAREALRVHVRARMGSSDVLEALYPPLLKHGKPDHIQSDTSGSKYASARARNPAAKWPINGG